MPKKASKCEEFERRARLLAEAREAFARSKAMEVLAEAHAASHEQAAETLAAEAAEEVAATTAGYAKRAKKQRRKDTAAQLSGFTNVEKLEFEHDVRELAQAREADPKAKAVEPKAAALSGSAPPTDETPAEARKRKNREKKRKRKAGPEHEEAASEDGAAAERGTAAAAAASKVAAATASAKLAAATAAASASANSKPSPLAGVSPHPFIADLGDHCETPPEAYADIAPLLKGIAKDLGVHPAKLRLYDPYFCEGSMKAHLNRLGFHTVLNRNVDFYTSPLSPDEYDVLLTNPPYSGDHVPRILAFCAGLAKLATSGSTAGGARPKPWLLLVPDYVHAKPYYAGLVPPSQGVCYVWPWRRYAYTSPAGLRGGRPVAVAPFESVWHCQLHGSALRHWASAGGAICDGRGDRFGGWAKGAAAGQGSAQANGRPALACKLFPTLALLVGMADAKADQIARTAKRPNPKARKRNATKIGELRKDASAVWKAAQAAEAHQPEG